MNRPYTVIQCSNYFEYINFKVNFNVLKLAKEYADSTYTIKLYVNSRNTLKSMIFKSMIFKHAPTATVTSVSFKNGRAVYTKLKA